MNSFLILAFLFFVGSVSGWVLELLFRNRGVFKGNLINPGFCTGPYLPIYGFGLCAMYIFASLASHDFIDSPFWNKFLLFIFMSLFVTAMEYFAGYICLKYFKVRLWDYSGQKGNINGLICPKFSLIWSAIGAVYYFLIHKQVLKGLEWLSNNLGFSFVIGVFFGVFIIDVIHSADLVVKLKKYAEANSVIVKYEELKKNIKASRERAQQKYNFFRPFQSDSPITVHLKELQESFENHVKPKDRKKH